jgi:hypothetical protein
MPYWVEFNLMRSDKDLDMFDETSCFKKIKVNKDRKKKSISFSASDYSFKKK